MAKLTKGTCQAPYIIFLGPPGSGKGTQAEKLRDNFRLIHLSTGNLFRENITKGTPLGLQVKELLSEGKFVPDELTVAMVMDRLAKPDTLMGVIFDGFPRNRDQAVALHNRFEERGKCITAAIYFRVDDDVLVDRLGARRMCPVDNATYNLVSKPPLDDERCDICGTPLVLRDDDKPGIVRSRLRIYREQTEPLIEFYREQDLLLEVDGAQSIEKIVAELDAYMPTLFDHANRDQV